MGHTCREGLFRVSAVCWFFIPNKQHVPRRSPKETQSRPCGAAASTSPHASLSLGCGRWETAPQGPRRYEDEDQRLWPAGWPDPGLATRPHSRHLQAPQGRQLPRHLRSAVSLVAPEHDDTRSLQAPGATLEPCCTEVPVLPSGRAPTCPRCSGRALPCRACGTQAATIAVSKQKRPCVQWPCSCSDSSSDQNLCPSHSVICGFHTYLPKGTQ